MNIQIVLPQLAEKGGMDKVINEFADFLNNKGEKIAVVQLVDTGLIWWNENIRVDSLLKASDNPDFRMAADAYAKYLSKIGGENAPDIILAAGWPVTITIVREALNKAASESKLIAWPHMTFEEAVDKEVGNISCINDADAIIAISSQVEKEIINSKIAIPIIRIDNGVTFPQYDCSNRKTQLSLKLLFAGRLVDSKNIGLIFKSLSKTKERWQLKVVGSGELDKTKALCSYYGVDDRVIFAGFKDDPYVDNDDISFCIVSSDYEGFCLVIPEALSHGIPVISTPVGCATDIIKPGENGYLYGVGDGDMLAQILDMISENRLPIPRADVCVKSVLRYDNNVVFEDFYKKLIKCVAG